MPQPAQPLPYVLLVIGNCPGLPGGRWGWRQISTALWCPGPHTWYNGADSGSQKRKLEL